uniref:ATP synthase F0 subunit 8 n=1 Tax=Ornithodoros improvisus TaxID=2952141 RepID=UPI00286AF1EE|nr:ATP synthase F0 subunit 8 [Ornithodoros improvisus]WKW52630.1 ATP synthase F0 subunit 8 [Ornithodoros improvisus]
MPQLFPMNWSFLTMSFMTILMTSIIMMYFNSIPKNQPSKKFHKSFEMTWKW